MSVKIALLTRNDAESVEITLKKFNDSKIDKNDVLIIDGQSTDDTLEIIRNSGFDFLIQEKRGRGNAFRLACREVDADYVILFSSDGEESFEDLLELFSLLKNALPEEYDLIIMSRLKNGNYFKSRYNPKYIPRLFILKLFNLITNMFFNRTDEKITDCWNGFRAINRKRFMDLKTRENFHGIELESTIKMLKAGCKVKELPTIEEERISGESKLPPFQTIAELFKLVWREYDIINQKNI
ncbi:glycosyltransferase family 2 protein [bacterium]